MKKADIRTEIDDRSEKIGKKIRDTELLKVPYMLILGEKEITENRISVRRQGRGDAGVMELSVFISELTEGIKARKAELP